MRGKYVFVDFWSTSCAPCIAGFPEIAEAYEKYSRKEFEIISVGDIRGDIDIKEFVTDKNVTWPTIHEKSPSSNTKGYVINSWPTTYLIDPKGIIIATNLREKDLDNKLELLNISLNH